MAIKSQILLNLVDWSATLSISTPDDVVISDLEFSSNQVTFLARDDISIAAADFLLFVDQLNLFQANLLSNFLLNIKAVFPYGVSDVNINHDIPTNAVSIVAHYNGNPRAVSYLATSNDGMVLFNKRNSNKTLEFAEWIDLLYHLNHFKALVKALNGI
jgi:hypothetical protein